MKKRCVYSGRIIGNRPVVLEEFVIDYVKKMGYLVSRFRFAFLSLLLLFLPVVQAGVFTIDFTNRINVVLLFMFFLVALILAFFRLFVFSSLIFVILGFLMLFNDINVILSFIAVAGGVVVAFVK